VRFLDNVLEVNKYPIPEIYDVTNSCRKIGLGVMGWADLLIKLGVPYDSEEALHLASQVSMFYSSKAVEASEELATERGAFPLFEQSKWKEKGHVPRRNATATVIAPTGTISILAGCSSGIEPVFALCQTRNQAGMTMTDLSKSFVEVAKREGLYSQQLADHISEHGSVQNYPGLPERWKGVFKIANEVDTDTHVKMQAAWQEHVEDGVSKTINLPKTATVEDVEAAYSLAWELGCKGITVYRDGCRPNQVLSVGTTKQAQQGVYKRRRVPANGRRSGETITKATPHGSVHVTINRHPDDNKPFELFIEMGKSGTTLTSLTEAMGRSLSLMLGTSVDPDKTLHDLASQLAYIGSGESSGFGENKIVSIPDGIAHAIRDFLSEPSQKIEVRDICPECKQGTLHKGGKCDLCESCGYSKC
jgi:ribonucleoside-diphosphate reductase alpha chain